MFEPQFTNRSEEGLDLTTNGFGDRDYAVEGDSYEITDTIYKTNEEELEHEPNLEQ